MSKPAIKKATRAAFTRLPLTAAIYIAIGGVAVAETNAQDTSTSSSSSSDEKRPVLDAVQVTAQKRQENLQEVPISIQVLDTQTLQERNVNDFEDYAKLLPSLSFQSGDGGVPTPYFRGVVSGNDGNHSASSPSVGVYLDEQPVTTIGGALDVHMYDIARIESLAGPQGTLYGASSQSGTLKIITNKPDPSGFSAGLALEANTVSGGGDGYNAEAFVNLPLGDSAALRLVGWSQKEAGYIDNVFGTRTFPVSGVTINNANRAEENYNSAEISGLRAALRVDLTENWSIMPSLITQTRKANGNFSYDPNVGDLKITHFYPESIKDDWIQAALTVNGKIGNFDVTYAFANLDRDIDSNSDYNDYGFWYDHVAGYGVYFTDNGGTPINPSQYIQGKDGYKKTSHELRIASPQDRRFRFILGYFMQDQSHDIEQRYRIDGLNDTIEVRGWPDTIWLTKQLREDDEKAFFGEFSFDFTDSFSVTAGFRRYENDNSLKGFFGYGENFAFTGPTNGEGACVAQYGPNSALWVPFNGAPCVVFDKRIEESGTLKKFTANYKFSDSKMIYGTWSEGYRPGGINRRGTLPPYLADFLTNIEFGWKTTWMDNRLAFNGAIFRQEWEDFQFALLGQNGLTEIKNANQARIDGLEMDLRWRATYNLTLSAGVGYYDGKLTENYCGAASPITNLPITNCPAGSTVDGISFPDGPEAPDGTRLPVTAKFKGSVNARYEFDVGEYEVYFQGSVVHEGERRSDLRIVENDILGNLPSYEMFDFSVGFGKDGWKLSLYAKNLTDERAEYGRGTQCRESICGASGPQLFGPVPGYPNGQVYRTVSTPRTIGLRFEKEF